MLKSAHRNLLLSLTLFSIFCYGCGKVKSDRSGNKSDINNPEVSATVDTIESFGVKYLPGEYKIDTGTIKSNQLLTEILSAYGISNEQAILLLDRDTSGFDVRKMKAGKRYFTMIPSDTSVSGPYFVYEIDLANYYFFDFSSDSGRIHKFVKPVIVKEFVRQGVISRTLYHTILDMNAPIELGLALSDVYAWQIDFFRIQKNDRFKVLYREKFVDDQSLGVDDIIAACFIHFGDTFYAYKFQQDSSNQYFDENGKSLRKAFLKAPLKYSRISSRYTKRRFHPVQKRYKAHLGTDYAAPTGTPIRSVGDGVVTAASYSRGNGRYVKVKHNSVYTTQYLHMSRFSGSAKVGRYVRQGEIIGYVGSTGLATGPHLCFRFWKNGVQVDPFQVKIPPSTPVKEELLEEFRSTRDLLKNRLDEIEWMNVTDESPETVQ